MAPGRPVELETRPRWLWRPRLSRYGRKRVLRITERGIVAMAEAAPHVRQPGQRLLAQLDDAEREQFLGYLGHVGDH